MRILLIEDDNVIASNIKSLLSKKGYSIDLAYSVEEGYLKAIDEEYDLFVIDRGLPDGDGIQLVPKLRNDQSNTPILFLTAMNEDKDIVGGLNSGADDYLSKPFDANVLLARVKALTRRSNRIPQKPIINIKDLMINTNTALVKRAGKEIHLSPREYSILEYLSIHKNQIVDRMTLLSHSWDENTDSFSNTVDVHIAYLRNKIDKGHTTKLIQTVRGKGYMICES